MRDEIEGDRSKNIGADECGEKWERPYATPYAQNQQQRHMSDEASRPEQEVETSQMHYVLPFGRLSEMVVMRGYFILDAEPRGSSEPHRVMSAQDLLQLQRETG